MIWHREAYLIFDEGDSKRNLYRTVSLFFKAKQVIPHPYRPNCNSGMQNNVIHEKTVHKIMYPEAPSSFVF